MRVELQGLQCGCRLDVCGAGGMRVARNRCGADTDQHPQLRGGCGSEFPTRAELYLKLGWLLAASALTRCETSRGCNGIEQHVGEYANTPPSVSGSGTLVDPMVGGSPLLTESLLD